MEPLDSVRKASVTTAPRSIVEVVPGVFAVPVRGSTSFIIDDESVTIIDTGAPRSGASILAALDAIGRPPADVGCIVLTHAHIDHVGGLPELQRVITAPAAAHVLDTPAIASQAPLPTPFRHRVLAIAARPVLHRLDPGPARIDVELEDGEAIPGSMTLFAVHLPGHTPGSIAIHDRARGVMFVGDAMEYRREHLSAPNRFFTQDMERARASMRTLARMEFRTICFSHFTPIREDASDVVRACVAAWEA